MTERPSQARRDLGHMLHDARRAAGFTSHDKMGDKVDFSQATLSRIESGRKKVSVSELRTLLDLYRPANRAEIEELAVRARADKAGLDSNFQTLREREKVADRVRKFTGERIPTALQSGRYILKQHKLASVRYDLSDVVRGHENLVANLKQEQGPLYEVVMSYSSLLRMPGGDLSMIDEQALHMLELLDAAPRLSLRVLTFGANIPYFDPDFTIVTGGGPPDMIYAQSGQDGFILTDKKKVKEREDYWDTVQPAALSIEETRALLRKLAERKVESLDEWFPIAK